MKAVCCICFNLLDDLHIAACPCGHTFHEECLMRWIDTSSTCPSCRTDINKDQIIKRLFFDIDESCHEDVDVDTLLNQINNLKVQLGEKDKQILELAESRDRLSTLFADSEAAREILLTKLNEEKNIKDVMQRDITVILKENAAFIKEMKEFRNQSKLQELQNNETLLKECKSDAQEVVGQYSEDEEPSLKHLTSILTVFKGEYKKVLSENTILQGQVSGLKHSHSEAQKCKEEVKNLRNCLENTNRILKQTMAENNKISSEITETLSFHQKVLSKNNVNTDTCTSATVSCVSRENLKRKFVSELDGPKLKSPNVSAASEQLETTKLTKSTNTVDDDVYKTKVLQELFTFMQNYTVSEHT